MRQIMCVHLPQWPIDRLTRKSRSCTPDQPIVLVETIATRQLVAIASPAATTYGIRPEMTLAQARALCPGLKHAPHTPARDRRALESLARWMTRFTPIVSLPPTDTHSIFLDVTGCQRVFGGLPNLAEQVDEALCVMQLHARIVIAPTPGAAYALASAGKHNGRIIPPTEIRDALAPLPPIALRIGRNTAEALYHLGVETVGQLLQLPRDAMPSRFGPELLTRIDQALGRIPEPLTPLTYHAPIEARLDFDGVIDSLEAIWLAFKDLINKVIADLSRRGCGARKLEVEFDRPDAPKILKTIFLSRPSRNPANLFNLMRCAMEGLEQAAQTHGTKPRRGKLAIARLATSSDSMIPAGFTAIHLSVPIFEQITDDQIPLLAQEEHDGQLELDHLIERLLLRLGDNAIAHARLLESYVPERAYDTGFGVQGSGFRTESPTASIRPLHLLSQPTEIRVMVCPSHDCDGQPISFTRDDQVHQVTHAVGPERIAGQWWEGHNRTRDYFAVEDQTGRRWWVFRVRETSKWYLHGSFE